MQKGETPNFTSVRKAAHDAELYYYDVNVKNIINISGILYSILYTCLLHLLYLTLLSSGSRTTHDILL